MIPKIVHYCWFGNNEKSETIKAYINTWKDVLKDYEFREWSEKDLDKLSDNIYVKEAYNAKKWAFVSDVFRLYALYTEGGIYLDTDVEVKKSFDDLLNLDFFIGSEKGKKSFNLGTAVIGASKNNQIIEDMLGAYQNRSFFKEDGSFDMSANPIILGNIMKNYGISNDIYSSLSPFEFKEKSIIFPYNFFSYEASLSYAVHHFEGSWIDAYALRKKVILPIWNNKCVHFYWYKSKNKKAKFISPLDKNVLEYNLNKYKFVIGITC